MHRHRTLNRWLAAALLLLFGTAHAVQEDDLLPPDDAYRISGQALDGNAVRVVWNIAKGYYLYKSKIRFSTASANVTLGTPAMPPGEVKHDPVFGDLKVYRGRVEIRIPYTRKAGASDLLSLEASSQGCADRGICYPPHRQSLLLNLASPASATRPAPPITPVAGPKSALDRLADLGKTLGLSGEDDGILDPDQAYRFDASVAAPDRLHLAWTIADGTYLYRDKVRISLEGGDGVHLGHYTLPEATIKHDTIRPDGSVGDEAIYLHGIDLAVPLVRSSTAATEATLVARYQGCAERGICYPPITRKVTLKLPALGGKPAAATPTKPAPAAAPPAVSPAAASTPAPAPGAPGPVSEQDRIAATLAGGNTWLIVATFFGFGLLLAFTPCVFPMIPILSGIIAGQGRNITPRRAFVLSLVYVLAMALTYAAAGVLAGLFGKNLQAAFQDPWILGAFALVFVALSLSMFGFYDLQLPSALQSRITEVSNKQRGGTLAGVAVMGLLSALIVGPCVAPPLAGALIYIGQTGDGFLGFISLFAMALGMGAPLVAIGTSAGKLLPRAGKWMDTVKAVFGVLLLGVAIVLLERILPAAATMLLWGALLINSAVYMGALRSLPVEASGWDRLWKGVGVVLLVYGALMLVGAAAGGKDTLQPLRGLLPVAAGPGAEAAELRFKRIKTVADLKREIAAAAAAGRPAMLDFYADWCVSCKEMERYTFSDAGVIAALQGVQLLQADVTANDADDQALLQGHFGIPGPPAIMFFGPDGKERPGYRVVGFVPAKAFAAHVAKATR
jgi:thiol:disulfide interchange protein DsbD